MNAGRGKGRARETAMSAAKWDYGTLNVVSTDE